MDTDEGVERLEELEEARGLEVAVMAPVIAARDAVYEGLESIVQFTEGLTNETYERDRETCR